MPRKLPWQVKSSANLVSQKKVSTSKNSPQKRQRREAVDSEMDRNGKRRAADAKDLPPPPSSSPPPEPPVETLMKEGIDYDDKYRMVEDEFLAVAQRFTMHLHAAEYKRQQKLAKTRNAETISSITRPVAGKMPDHTRRKVEAVARVKSQKAAIEGLLEKKSDHSDDSDSEELPYVGTTLHGLMDSPRKKTASFAKLGIMATTRAAAGYKKPAASKPEQNTLVYSTQYKKPSKEVFKYEKIESVESSEDYDDLDGPAPAPELTTVSRKSSTNLQEDRVTSKKTLSNSSFSEPAVKPNSLIHGATLSRSSLANEITNDIKERDPRSFRPEHVRRRRHKQAKEQQPTENFSVIPTFL